MRNLVNSTQPGAVVSGMIVQDDDARFYKWFGVDCTCPKDILTILNNAAGQPVVLGIDSPGGSMTAAAAMYEACMAYNGAITFEISCAASAASLLSMASAKEGNKSRISPLGLMFTHNAQSGADGDYRDMEKARDMLLAANQVVVNAYRLKTGMDDEKIRVMMDKDTMLAAQDALSLGLVDEIMHQDGENTIDFSNEQLDLIKGRTRDLMNAMPTPSRQAIEQFREHQQQQLNNANPQTPANLAPPLAGVMNESETEFGLAMLEIEKARY